MNAFVFQSVPERFDLRQEIYPGRRDVWYATRYRSEMNPGDVVFFWMGGEESVRGIYGWGRLTSEPYLKREWDSHGVDVQYDVKFAKPILAKSIHADTQLSQMLIFRAPQATNFLLTHQQANRLIRLINVQGERAPALEGLGR
jgi:hypothetical protein